MTLNVFYKFVVSYACSNLNDNLFLCFVPQLLCIMIPTAYLYHTFHSFKFVLFFLITTSTNTTIVNIFLVLDTMFYKKSARNRTTRHSSLHSINTNIQPVILTYQQILFTYIRTHTA